MGILRFENFEGNSGGIFGIFFLEFFGNSNGILCGLLGNSLGILREFLGNSLGILREFFGDVWFGVLNVWVLILGNLS